ncbi:hypothetical protein LCGC14_2005120, partial [marine sediment metagenome]
AVQAGLQGELKEQAFDLEIQRMEEEARQRASQRKEIVTEEGAKNQAAANRLLQIIEDPESPFSQGEREQMKQKEVGLRNNVLTQVTDLTPKPPPEYALWSSGIMDDGTGRPYDVDGDGKRTIGSAKDTTAGIESERQHEMKIAEIEKTEELKKQQQVKEETRNTERKRYFRELQKTPKKVPKVREDGSVEFIDQYRSREESWAEALDLYPISTQQPVLQQVDPAQAAPIQQQQVDPTQAAPIQQQQVDPSSLREWWMAPQFEDVEILKSEKRLGPKVGAAKAGIRTLLSQYNYQEERMSQEDKISLEIMREIVKRFNIDRSRKNRGA